ncbi:MAG: YncE family protein [Candidatus Sulfotelmatobacter sp.]
MQISVVKRGSTWALFVCLLTTLAAAATPQYVLTNDDATVFSIDSVTFYTIGTGGALELYKQVPTGGAGIAGGFFGANRLAMLNNGDTQCVYASLAATGGIVGIDVSTLEVVGTTYGSGTDNGSANGIGLAINNQYLYASYTTSNTIATFQVQPGCGLSFVSDLTVVGLQGGFGDGMAISGSTMVVSYGDGSIQSFNISSGVPVSNGDLQNSTGAIASGYASYPTSVEITQDGHYAIFGDTSTSTVVEVSDISSGKLKKTVSYSLGNGNNSSNILLSPDETLLYVVNTQGDTLSAAFFNAVTGKLTPGCISGTLKGYVSDWSYLGGLSLQTSTGTGDVVYVAEFGTASGIGMINATSANGKCTLTETANSPASDPYSPGLLSIGTFPPRTF